MKKITQFEVPQLEASSEETVSVSPQADLAAQRQKNEAARRLLQEWIADESGYDEEMWPQIKQIIEDNRLSLRSRFSD
jgi:hypothetical protein